MTSEKDVLDYFEERFGISRKLFREFSLYSDQKGRVFLAPKNLAAEGIAVSVGMQIARIGNSIKPSTNLLQLFGRHATRNALSVTKEQAVAYAKGDDIKLPTKPEKVSDGYVLLKYLGYPLGCGLLKEGQIKNVLPKARRMNVKFA
jgi:NOL1/NOP2/fmu family ribosome biogenesis protein